MEDKKLETLNGINTMIQNYKDGDYKFVFVIPDTKGAPMATVSNLYRNALSLKNHGFNVVMLLELDQMDKVDLWMDKKFVEELPHYTMDGKSFEIKSSDIIIVPELYASIIKTLNEKGINCTKILFINSFEYVSEGLDFTDKWSYLGVDKAITTTDTLAELIKTWHGIKDVKVINPMIPNMFTEKRKAKSPNIAIHFRSKRKTRRFIKMFYDKYPHLAFFTFIDFHGLSEETMADMLDTCMVALWDDPISSFGTFPIEANKCNVPIIARPADISAEWYSDNNGIWVKDHIQMLSILSAYITAWLNCDDKLKDYSNVKDVVADLYTEDKFNDNVKRVYDLIVNEKIDMLEKIKANFETN